MIAALLRAGRWIAVHPWIVAVMGVLGAVAAVAHRSGRRSHQVDSIEAQAELVEGNQEDVAAATDDVAQARKTTAAKVEAHDAQLRSRLSVPLSDADAAAQAERLKKWRR